MPKRKRAAWQSTALVLGCVALAAALRLALHPLLQDRAVFLLFIIAVTVCAHVSGLRAGLAATGLSALAVFGLRLMPPIFGPQSLQMAMFLAIAIPVSVLGGRLRESLDRERAALERERRLLESESQARADAERANRVKDQFLAVLSHELRSPLNAIVGWAHVLKNMKLSKEVDKGLDTILRNADQQVRLIADLFDLSQAVMGKLALEATVVDLRSVLDHAVDAVRLAADARGVRLQLLLPESPLEVRGDAGRLQQVFWNLLSNAVKFSASGSSVHASAELRGDEVLVTVADGGQGISAEFLPFVFDSFTQERLSKDRRHAGLGLGLAIVRHLTEAHGGTVQVTSRGEGEGSTFSVRLPHCKAPAGEATADHPAATGHLNGLHILVVEDDAEGLRLLARILSDLGATVIAAASAAEARRHLAELSPDVIVSDIGMPGEDGLSFIRELRRTSKQHQNVPAIALTAYASAADRTEALDAGFNLHVAKPVQPYLLARAIVASLGPASAPASSRAESVAQRHQ